MHCSIWFLFAVIRNDKLKVRDLKNNCNRDINTCSQFRVSISKEKNLYVLQKTSKMQFYIRVSVIMVSMLLFHTHTEAYQTLTLLPANPSKCSIEVTTSPYVLHDLSKVLIYACSNSGHIRKLYMFDKNYAVIKAVRRTTY
jgi:hypothetical protein